MAVYTHLSDDDIQRIADAYGIGQIVHTKAIAEGVENSNYLIAASLPSPGSALAERTCRTSCIDHSTPQAGAISGARLESNAFQGRGNAAAENSPHLTSPRKQGEEILSTKYILTIYEKRVNLTDIPFYLGIMEHLAEHGIPCPLPLHTKDGATTFPVGEKRAAIVTFLEGKSPTGIRNEHMRPLGAMMAKMHLAAESFSGGRVNDLSVSGWHRLMDKIGSKADEVLPGLTELIHTELAYLEIHWPKDGDLPRGVIHADLFPDNVFYLDGNLSGFIDFYFACTDFYIYDLIITMNAWCFEHEQFNVTKAGLLLAAYNQVKPLTKAEMEAMPLLARGASLRFLLTRAHDMVFHDPNAIVTPKNPMEYVKKLQFHQRVKSVGEYGL